MVVPTSAERSRSIKVGYARVSTEDQCLDLQLSALEKAGCSMIYKDHGISGATMERPGLASALRTLKPGSTLVVWRLDRLGRSLAGLVETVETLGESGIEFQSLAEGFDTTTHGGRLIFHIMAALSEFERSLISERTRAGMRSAAARGVKLGRPRLLTEPTIETALQNLQNPDATVPQVANELGVSRRTLERAIKARVRSTKT
ncbi:MAG: recombinase family protein [Rhodobacteraceae bacterium]|nr:recombinase family protein [Paracoccaceae bacterium]